MEAKKTTAKEENRGKIIVRTGMIGILANLLLAAFKVTIGFFSNSISVMLDGINNLSDAFSSVITIVGTKLSEKPDGSGRLSGHSGKRSTSGAGHGSSRPNA